MSTTADEAEPPREPGLSNSFRRLARQRVLIISLGVLGAIAALALSAAQTTKYQSEASVSFAGANTAIGIVGSVPDTSQQPAQLATAAADTIKRGEVLARVQQSLGPRYSISELRSDVQATVNPNSNLVLITATTDRAASSALVANAVANEAVYVAVTQARSQYSAAAEKLRARLNSLSAGVAGAAERQSLATDISRLDSLSVLATPARIAQTASAASAPSSASPIGNAVLGGFVGLLIGLFAAAARDSLDRRLRDADEITEVAGFPLLGQVGRSALGQLAAGTSDAVHDANLESFRILRSNLEMVDRNSPAKTIVVTSAVAEEGKTTVASSLASGMAVAGKLVLLVDCDLRRPALAERIGVSPAAPGLTDYLTGSAEPHEVLQTVPAHDLASRNGAFAGVHTRPLTCISAGSRHPHPAELLSDHERFEAFLREVSTTYDAVIIDSCPLLPVADTLQLLPFVDRALLCVRASFTTRAQLTAAKDALARFAGLQVGLVITGVREDPGSGYYPGYYYGEDPSPTRRQPLGRR